MEAARLAVANFTSKRGHTTEVHETVLPAVTRETVRPTRHEITTEAIDREVHQHHYHTTVQPLKHIETLPAVHTHNLIPVKHVQFEHGDREAAKLRVAEELAAFKNDTVVMPTILTKAANTPVIGEHFHHHVHEVVQPIIYKETITPQVVHTTMPIHETHHHEPIHHGISQLQAKPMAEFTKLGGLLTGSKGTTRETYEGAPRAYLPELSTSLEKLGFGRGMNNGTRTTTNTVTSGPRTVTTGPTTVTHTTSTPRSNIQTGTTTSTRVEHRPAAIMTTPNRRSMGDNASPLSSPSTSSSPSMPSTPTNHKFNDEVAVQRASEGLSPPSSPQYNANEFEAKNAQNTGFISRIRSHGRKSLEQRQ